MKRKLLAAVLCAMILVSVFGTNMVSAQSAPNAVEEAQSFLNGIVAFGQGEAGADSVQAWIDGGLTGEAGGSAEWYILGLSQSGDYDFSAYEAALLDYLENKVILSAASRQKYALCLSAVGSTDCYISAVMNDSIGEQGVMSLIYGLHLLNNGYESSVYTVERVIGELLAMQCADGGWSLTGQAGDVDVSAMAVQALAVHERTDPAVSASIGRALEFLSRRQCPEGDYASYGVDNPESGAQVLVALSALGIDCAADERFIKNGHTILDGIAAYRLENGSFCHTAEGASNSNATAQVFYAMVAYLRMVNGQPPLYLLDGSRPEEVEAAPEKTEPTGGSEPLIDSSAETGADPGAPRQTASYKPWVCLILLIAGGTVCLILILLKKRSIKNFLAVLLAVALAMTVVCVTDFRSAEEYYHGETVAKPNAVGTVTMTIRCDTVAGKSDAEYIPEDGVILEVTEFAIEEGDTVYDLLTEAARVYHIQVEKNGTADMVYIAGINYLYEMAFGDLSGWVYHVNGVSPSMGGGDYVLSDGDRVEWLYTCDLGNDVK